MKVGVHFAKRAFDVRHVALEHFKLRIGFCINGLNSRFYTAISSRRSRFPSSIMQSLIRVNF